MPHQHNPSRARPGHRTTRRVAAGGLAAVAAMAGLAAGPGAVAGAAAAGPAVPRATAPTSLVGWGLDFFDQLGDGRSGLINGVDAHSTTPVPLQITGRTIVRATTGCDHTVVQTVGEQLLSWGENDLGQLGNGRTGGNGLTVAQRVVIPGSPAIADVQATCESTSLLTTDGRVLAWGDNTEGQLGQGTTGGFSVLPVAVHLPAGTRVTAISTSGDYTLALTASGQVLAWGKSAGELAGHAPSTAITTPTPVAFPAGTGPITAIAAGSGHALFLTRAGQVLAEGDNMVGELGTGKAGAVGNDTHNGSATPVPVALKPGTTVTAIAAGEGLSLALTSTGGVLAWGNDNHGELGDGAPLPGKFSASPVPVVLPAGVRVTSVSAHAELSLALTSTGQVLAWGENEDGELGNGTVTAGSSKPGLVKIPGDLVATGVVTGDDAETGFALVRPAPPV